MWNISLINFYIDYMLEGQFRYIGSNKIYKSSFHLFIFSFLFFFSCFWYGTRRYEIWHLWLMSYLLDGTAGQKRDLWTLSEDFPAYFLPMSWSFISSFNYLKASQYFIDSCINYLKFISISCHKIKLQDVARIQKKIKSPWVLLK